MNLTRRDTLTLAAAATLAGAAGLPTLALAKDGDVIDQLKLLAPMAVPDRVEGDAAAKVTVIEYLSPTCPHCARVAINVIPAFKEKYVKTGKVKFIPRPFARNTLDVAIFMIAEAASQATDKGAAPAATDASSSSALADSSSSAPAATGPAPGYSEAAIATWENVIDTFFKTQETWAVSDKPLDALKAVAFQLGFSEDSFMAALKDNDYFAKIQTMQQQAVNDFGLAGTPTFYINGKTISGEKTLDELSTEIDPLVG